MKNISCFKEFAKYSTFNVLGMIGLSCYILADTFFISKGLGAKGLAALNIAIPMYSFIQGGGLMIGIGAATKYSIFMSQNDSDSANYAFTNAVFLAGGFSAIFFTMGIFFSEALAVAFGADEAVLKMSETYLRVMLLFAPMFMINNVLLCFIRNDGAPHLSMAAMIGGSLSNIVLDYVFIFPLKMGIFGAVLATGLAPIISVLVLLPFLIRKQNRFHLRKSKLFVKLTLGIFSGGLPSLVSEVSSGLVIIVFNIIIFNLQGNIGIAAYGVIANLSLVVIAVYTGIAQGIQPILSSNYGAGNSSNVQAILRYAMISMFVISGIIYTFVFLGAEGIAGMFNSEQNLTLQSIAVTGLKYYFTACPFAGFNILMSVYFTSTDFAFPAHVISVMRGLAVIIPMAFLLSRIAGIIGVWCVFPATELLVAILSIALCSKAVFKQKNLNE